MEHLAGDFLFIDCFNNHRWVVHFIFREWLSTNLIKFPSFCIRWWTSAQIKINFHTNPAGHRENANHRFDDHKIPFVIDRFIFSMNFDWRRIIFHNKADVLHLRHSISLFSSPHYNHLFSKNNRTLDYSFSKIHRNTWNGFESIYTLGILKFREWESNYGSNG